MDNDYDPLTPDLSRQPDDQLSFQHGAPKNFHDDDQDLPANFAREGVKFDHPDDQYNNPNNYPGDHQHPNPFGDEERGFHDHEHPSRDQYEYDGDDTESEGRLGDSTNSNPFDHGDAMLVAGARSSEEYNDDGRHMMAYGEDAGRIQDAGIVYGDEDDSQSDDDEEEGGFARDDIDDQRFESSGGSSSFPEHDHHQQFGNTAAASPPESDRYPAVVGATEFERSEDDVGILESNRECEFESGGHGGVYLGQGDVSGEIPRQEMTAPIASGDVGYESPDDEEDDEDDVNDGLGDSGRKGGSDTDFNTGVGFGYTKMEEEPVSTTEDVSGDDERGGGGEEEERDEAGIDNHAFDDNDGEVLKRGDNDDEKRIDDEVDFRPGSVVAAEKFDKDEDQKDNIEFESIPQQQNPCIQVCDPCSNMPPGNEYEEDQNDLEREMNITPMQSDGVVVAGVGLGKDEEDDEDEDDDEIKEPPGQYDDADVEDRNKYEDGFVDEEKEQVGAVVDDIGDKDYDDDDRQMDYEEDKENMNYMMDERREFDNENASDVQERMDVSNIPVNESAPMVVDVKEEEEEDEEEEEEEEEEDERHSFESGVQSSIVNEEKIANEELNTSDDKDAAAEPYRPEDQLGSQTDQSSFEHGNTPSNFGDDNTLMMSSLSRGKGEEEEESGGDHKPPRSFVDMIDDMASPDTVPQPLPSPPKPETVSQFDPLAPGSASEDDEDDDQYERNNTQENGFIMEKQHDYQYNNEQDYQQNDEQKYQHEDQYQQQQEYYQQEQQHVEFQQQEQQQNYQHENAFDVSDSVKHQDILLEEQNNQFQQEQHQHQEQHDEYYQQESSSEHHHQQQQQQSSNLEDTAYYDGHNYNSSDSQQITTTDETTRDESSDDLCLRAGEVEGETKFGVDGSAITTSSEEPQIEAPAAVPAPNALMGSGDEGDDQDDSQSLAKSSGEQQLRDNLQYDEDDDDEAERAGQATDYTTTTTSETEERSGVDMDSGSIGQTGQETDNALMSMSMEGSFYDDGGDLMGGADGMNNANNMENNLLIQSAITEVSEPTSSFSPHQDSVLRHEQQSFQQCLADEEQQTTEEDRLSPDMMRDEEEEPELPVHTTHESSAPIPSGFEDEPSSTITSTSNDFNDPGFEQQISEPNNSYAADDSSDQFACGHDEYDVINRPSEIDTLNAAPVQDSLLDLNTPENVSSSVDDFGVPSKHTDEIEPANDYGANSSGLDSDATPVINGFGNDDSISQSEIREEDHIVAPTPEIKDVSEEPQPAPASSSVDAVVVPPVKTSEAKDIKTGDKKKTTTTIKTKDTSTTKTTKDAKTTKTATKISTTTSATKKSATATTTTTTKKIPTTTRPSTASSTTSTTPRASRPTSARPTTTSTPRPTSTTTKSTPSTTRKPATPSTATDKKSPTKPTATSPSKPLPRYAQPITPRKPRDSSLSKTSPTTDTAKKPATPRTGLTPRPRPASATTRTTTTTTATTKTTTTTPRPRTTPTKLANGTTPTNGTTDKRSTSPTKRFTPTTSRTPASGGAAAKTTPRSTTTTPRTPATSGIRSPTKTTPRTPSSSATSRTGAAAANGKTPTPKKADYSNVTSRIGSKDKITHKPGGGNVKIETRKVKVEAKSKIGSLDNASHKPAGGDKKIEVKKLDWKVESKIGSLDNANHIAGGGDKKIEVQKTEWSATSKIGSLDKASHKPGGGDVKIETQKTDWSAQSKIGSLDNVKHKPGGGDKQVENGADGSSPV